VEAGIDDAAVAAAVPVAAVAPPPPLASLPAAATEAHEESRCSCWRLGWWPPSTGQEEAGAGAEGVGCEAAKESLECSPEVAPSDKLELLDTLRNFASASWYKELKDAEDDEGDSVASGSDRSSCGGDEAGEARTAACPSGG